jgi:ABC-type sugar transport system ATPase subunit
VRSHHCAAGWGNDRYAADGGHRSRRADSNDGGQERKNFGSPGPTFCWTGRALRRKPFDKLKNVSFELQRGEVLGIAGLVGAGVSELGAALLGLNRIHQGRLQLKGKPFTPKGRASATSWAGVGSGSPQSSRLNAAERAGKNSTLTILSRLSRWGFSRASQKSCSIQWRDACT